ncbi:MAG TPA: M20/M25/M40 family metallo-hydrolase [Bacteroidales bacterium]|nr:M20/M25/M40 family metallo-hydrolase [Bacteroidales bacterium]
MKKIFLILVIANFSFAAYAQEEALSTITEKDLRSHMTFFASDELQGREAGTLANDAAALYIMSNLIRFDVNTIPQTGSYLQEIPIQKTVTKNTITFKSGNDIFSDSLFLLLPTFQSMETTSQVVFAGFGHIDEEAGYNEIKDLDMKNKIVIVMTGTPGSVSDGSDTSEIFSDAENLKLSRILLKGAKAILLVYNPSSNFSDPYMSGLTSMVNTSEYNLEGGPVNGLPLQIGFISRDVANIILRPSGHNLKDIQENILSGGKPFTFEVPGENVTINTELRVEKLKNRNVIGIIEGSDPVLKNECIVYSAHFDHMGVSKEGIFNGADDNASGSMALLEIAEAFMSLEKKPARTIILAWMNAEEKGLIGSKYYVQNPVMPLSTTLLNINLDMVGRSKMETDTGTFRGMALTITAPRELEYYKDRNSSMFDDLVYESARSAGLKLIDKGVDLEFGGSDHMSFRSKGVTAIMFHSGIHADLHAIGDDVEKIDFDKMERTARMCFLLGYRIANAKESSKNKKRE